MRTDKGQWLALLLLWLVLVVVSLVSRSYIPIDETRYVTVAWNMWLRDDFLVPYLNGETYSHKPPLFFWLMNLGWFVFGVNDWWPRLIPSFFALGSMWMTVRLAALLWPQDDRTALLAPLMLMTSGLWAVFTTATMFDMMIATFTLLGMLGIVVAWQGNPIKGWLMVGIAIGLGLLAKGPTILLQILPAAALAPWWGGTAKPCNWRRWYAAMLAAVLLGALIALLWAIPAGIRGGEKYQNAIFWGQTADRMVNSFAHRRPLWWYVPLLPLMVFPWLLWLPVWRGFCKLAAQPGDEGLRFCLAWLVPVFLAFSFISGKQMHYLLPIFPPFALLAARGIVLSNGAGRRLDLLPLALVGAVMAAGLIYFPTYALTHGVVAWGQDIASWGGWLMLGALLLLMFLKADKAEVDARKIAGFGLFAVVLLYVSIIKPAGLAYDVRPIGSAMKRLEDAGIPMAYVGRYHGTFNFVGRLQASPQVTSRELLSDWFARHPEGRAIVIFNRSYPLRDLKPEYLQHYRGGQIAIVSREHWESWWALHRMGSAQSEETPAE